MIVAMIKRTVPAAVLLGLTLLSSGLLLACQPDTQQVKTVPHETAWGIYKLDIATQEITLVYNFPADSYPSGLQLNNNGDKFVFAQKAGDEPDENTEIYSIGIDGTNLKKLTDNDYFDVYPVWSRSEEHTSELQSR